MPILYVARKKVFRIAGQLKSLYYMVPKALQHRGSKDKEIAKSMAGSSSLTPGDVLSVLNQLPWEITNILKEGKTVTIDGLGTFYLAISSDGVEKPEDCTPATIRSYRICFRPDKNMTDMMLDSKFQRIPGTDKKE